ncbi:hypothetical protein [Antarcticimicrobium sp.]|uniref:hypothetical protein n=1 Tax=Antarcticimicrobium sp. TaxID=2824147 RepID=UPI00260D0EDE|nr:hypothetical protein [Antarcticimicrobium sp.]
MNDYGGIGVTERVCQDGCEAYRQFGTPDEIELDAMEFELREMSSGITAWRTIAFALERGLPFPIWVRSYLEQVASGIDDWAMLNGHPGEIKDILHLHGKRKYDNDQNDPRWIFEAISQMRAQNPKASIKSLVHECMKQFPQVGSDDEYVRQKYYQGKKLAETGQDYKGRDRKKEIHTSPDVGQSDAGGDDPDF